MGGRYGELSTPMGSHFGVGEFATHVGTYLSGDWDVHWGYDLGFEPWLLGWIFGL